MARVTKRSNGYDFAGLSGIGLRLVSEFQRHHPLLCVPSSHSDFIFIRLGYPQQNRLLAQLIAKVRIEDPDPILSEYTTQR